MRRGRAAIALTIAGSDSGGGAGIQADLKTFAILGVHGTSVITCITAQNPRRVLDVEPCGVGIVRAQMRAIFEELPPAAAKTGMLYSVGIIRTVAEYLRKRPLPLVVDPVMVSTSGTRLLETSAARYLATALLPLATLVTPNVSEAELLTNASISSAEDLRYAARILHERFGCAALVKGGHLRNGREAIDIFYDGKQELLLSAPFVRGIRTHGTGCTYSAAITAYLARGFTPPKAVIRAKNFVTQAIANNCKIGRHRVLSWA